MKKAPRRKNNLGHIKGGGEVFNQYYEYDAEEESREEVLNHSEVQSVHYKENATSPMCLTLLVQYLMHQLRLQLHIHSQLQSYE